MGENAAQTNTLTIPKLGRTGDPEPDGSHLGLSFQLRVSLRSALTLPQKFCDPALRGLSPTARPRLTLWGNAQPLAFGLGLAAWLRHAA
jgi:hypothetical protein